MQAIRSSGRVVRFALSRTTAGGAVGVLILSMVVACALFADMLSPHDPNHKQITLKLRPPIGADRSIEGHLLGTDQLGRDLLSRLIHGARPSLYVPLLATLIAMALGVTLGMLAGLSGGWLDLLLMLFNDTMLAVPAILIAIAITGAIGRTDAGVLIVILGLLGWVVYTRMVRSEVLTLREREFMAAAKAQGAGLFHLMFRHLLPNLWPLVLVIATLQIASFTLVEAALSYLGLGLPPGTPSWGRMVAEGQQHMFVAWWYALFPGLVITVYVTGLYLVGDWLRDLLGLRGRALP